MKKIILSFISLFALLFTSYSQEIQCVSCKMNSVNYEKLSSALGSNNISSGMSSFVGGFSSQATGDYSIGFGYMTLSNGLHSVAFGSESKATNTYGVAIGRYSYSTNVNAIAIGKYVESIGVSSFSVGTYLQNSGAFSVIIGSGESNSTRLSNNIENSLIVGFNSNIPTLFVGTSNGTGTTGKVGIGNVTAPTAKLHIRADAADDATLRLEPGTGKVSRIYFSNTDDYYVQAATNQNMIFRTPSGKNFHFENGKVVSASLQISSGFGSGKLLQSDASGNALWTDPAWNISSGNLYKPSGNVGIGYSNATTLNNKLEVNGYSNTTSGYKVGNIEVINSTKDYTGRNGNLSGNLSVTGSASLIGNVGIGTSPNSNKLTVNGTIEATSFSGDGTGLTNVRDNLGNHTATQNIKLSGKWLSGDGGDEGLSINNDGFVGIGITSPRSLLHLNSAADGAELSLSNSKTIITADDQLGTISARSYSYGSGGDASASLQFCADGNWAGGVWPTRISF